LTNVARLCAKETLRGNFNIIISPHEKNNSNYNDSWPWVDGILV